MADGDEGDVALSAWQRLAPWALASASPRRAELLRRAGMSFQVRAVPVDESALPAEEPGALCERLARKKAHAGATASPDECVLGGDTVVALADRVLGKPDDRDHAEGMLRALSGRTHQVFSAVALVAAARWVGADGESLGVSGVCCSTVSFDALDEQTLGAYLEGGEWQGKAGAYAIQGDASRFARLVSGNQDTVVGLPVALVKSLADELLELTGS